MKKYLDELESDLSALEDRIKYARNSYDDVEREFEKMEDKLDDIHNVIVENGYTAEEKLSIIREILAR